jgi:hypothetical protein
MASAVIGRAEEVTISSFRIVGLPLYLSLATIAFGVVAISQWRRCARP